MLPGTRPIDVSRRLAPALGHVLDVQRVADDVLDAVVPEAANAAVVARWIGPEGGEISREPGGRGLETRAYGLRIPAGALLEPVRITMMARRDLVDIERGGITRFAVQFGPSGLTFAEPAELRLEVDLEAIESESGLPSSLASIGWLPDDEEGLPWIPTTSMVREADSAVLARVDHFSLFGLYQPRVEPSTCLAPSQRPRVLLVHGLSGDIRTFGEGATQLANLLPGRSVYRFLYNSAQDIRVSAGQLGAAVEATCPASFAQTTLVTHSLGGLVSRAYLQGIGRLRVNPSDSDCDDVLWFLDASCTATTPAPAYSGNVTRVATLATPNAGAWGKDFVRELDASGDRSLTAYVQLAAGAGIPTSVLQMEKGSTFIRDLNALSLRDLPLPGFASSGSAPEYLTLKGELDGVVRGDDAYVSAPRAVSPTVVRREILGVGHTSWISVGIADIESVSHASYRDVCRFVGSCAPTVRVGESDAECADGRDNDYDGNADSWDSGCVSSLLEVCDNWYDDNNDDLTDCEDPQCAATPACCWATAGGCSFPRSCNIGCDMHGRCDTSSGTCVCDPGWSGVDCTVGPPTACASGDGLYCGQSVGRTSGTLYSCSMGVYSALGACAHGCIVNAAGVDDECGAPPPPACGSDALESNDSRASARSLTSAANGQTCEGDNDWFAIAGVSGREISLSLEFVTSSADLDLELTNSSGTRVAISESVSYNEQISWTPSASGNYYARVYSYDGNTAAYTLRLGAGGGTSTDGAAIVCGVSGVGTSSSTASVRVEGTYASVPICAAEQHWYAVELGAGSRLTARATVRSGDSPVSMTIRSTGTIYQSSGVGGPISHTAGTAQRVYVTLDTPESDGSVYSVSFDVEPRVTSTSAVVSRELSLTPGASVYRWDDLGATFDVRNSGSAAITLDAVRVAGASGATQHNFPSRANITIPAGGTYAYSATTQIPHEGLFTFAPAVQLDGVWLSLQTSGGFAAASRSVNVITPSEDAWQVEHFISSRDGTIAGHQRVFSAGEHPYFYLELTGLTPGYTQVQFNVYRLQTGADPFVGAYVQAFSTARATTGGRQTFVAEAGPLRLVSEYAYRIEAHVRTTGGWVKVAEEVLLSYGGARYVEGWAYKGEERSSVCYFTGGTCWPLNAEPFYFFFFPDDPRFRRTIWIEQADYDELTADTPCTVGASYASSGGVGCILYDPALPAPNQYAVREGASLMRMSRGAAERCFDEDRIFEARGITSIPGIFSFADSASSPTYCDPNYRATSLDCGDCRSRSFDCSTTTCQWVTGACVDDCDANEVCQADICELQLELNAGRFIAPAAGTELSYYGETLEWIGGYETYGQATKTALYCRYNSGAWILEAGFSSSDTDTVISPDPGDRVECKLRTRLDFDWDYTIDSPSRVWMADSRVAEFHVGDVSYSADRDPPAGCNDAYVRVTIENSGALEGVAEVNGWLVPAGSDSTDPAAIPAAMARNVRVAAGEAGVAELRFDTSALLSVNEGVWEFVIVAQDTGGWTDGDEVRVDARWRDLEAPVIEQFRFMGIAGTPQGVIAGRSYTASLAAADDFGVESIGWRWRAGAGSWTEIGTTVVPSDSCRARINSNTLSWTVPGALAPGTVVELEAWAVDYAGGRVSQTESVLVRPSGEPSVVFHSPTSSTVIPARTLDGPSKCIPVDIEVTAPIALTSVRARLSSADLPTYEDAIHSFSNVAAGGRFTTCAPSNDDGDRLLVRIKLNDVNGDEFAFDSELFVSQPTLMPWPWSRHIGDVVSAFPYNWPYYEIEGLVGSALAVSEQSSGMDLGTGDTLYTYSTHTIDVLSRTTTSTSVAIRDLVLPFSAPQVPPGTYRTTETTVDASCADPYSAEVCLYHLDEVTYVNGVEASRLRIASHSSSGTRRISGEGPFPTSDGLRTVLTYTRNGSSTETSSYRYNGTSWGLVANFGRLFARPAVVGDLAWSLSTRRPDNILRDVVRLDLRSPTTLVTERTYAEAEYPNVYYEPFVDGDVPGVLLFMDNGSGRFEVIKRIGGVWSVWSSFDLPSDLDRETYENWYFDRFVASNGHAALAVQGARSAGDSHGFILPIDESGVVGLGRASFMEETWSNFEQAVIAPDGRVFWVISCDWNMATRWCLLEGDFYGSEPCYPDDACESVVWDGLDGTCTRSPLVCDNGGDACGTQNECDPGSGLCAPLAGSSVVCDDGIACNGSEVCVSASGACGAGAALPVDDSIACTVDICAEPEGLVTHTPSDDACLVDACSVATCAPGTAGADPVTGCVVSSRTLPDDGLLCTSAVCDPNTGAISHTIAPGTCLIDGQCFSAGARNPVADCQLCLPAYDPLAWSVADDATLCDDGAWCTVDDTCQQGDCIGVQRDCLPTATGSCVRPWCDESLDTCLGIPAEDGTDCSDANICNGRESCAAGECVAAAAPALPDDTACATWTCDPVSGPVVTTNDGTCDADGDGCSVGDHCVDGLCIAGPQATCEPVAAPCGAAACVSLDSDSYECTTPSEPTEGQPCSDEDPCTVESYCDASGECIGDAYRCETPGDCQVLAGARCTGDGGCEYLAAPDGVRCAVGWCAGGACEPGTDPCLAPRVLSDGETLTLSLAARAPWAPFVDGLCPVSRADASLEWFVVPTADDRNYSVHVAAAFAFELVADASCDRSCGAVLSADEDGVVVHVFAADGADARLFAVVATGDTIGDIELTLASTPRCVTGTPGCMCYGNGTCDEGADCVDEHCVPITCAGGDPGCPCYRNGTCNAELICDDGTCREATCPDGDLGCPCYLNDTCNADLACEADLCVVRDCPDGTSGCACFGNSTCFAELICDDGLCVASEEPGDTGHDADAGSPGDAGLDVDSGDDDVDDTDVVVPDVDDRDSSSDVDAPDIADPADTVDVEDDGETADADTEVDSNSADSARVEDPPTDAPGEDPRGDSSLSDSDSEARGCRSSSPGPVPALLILFVALMLRVRRRVVSQPC